MSIGFRPSYSNAIQLQEVGLCRALPAEELRPGDVTVWNFGSRATVKRVAPKGKTMLAFVLTTERGDSPRNMTRTRLVGVTRETWIAHGRDPHEKPKMVKLGRYGALGADQ